MPAGLRLYSRAGFEKRLSKGRSVSRHMIKVEVIEHDHQSFIKKAKNICLAFDLRVLLFSRAGFEKRLSKGRKSSRSKSPKLGEICNHGNFYRGII